MTIVMVVTAFKMPFLAVAMATASISNVKGDRVMPPAMGIQPPAFGNVVP
jgi:hypothetical protein